MAQMTLPGTQCVTSCRQQTIRLASRFDRLRLPVIHARGNRALLQAANEASRPKEPAFRSSKPAKEWRLKVQNPYEILGIPHNAGPEEVRSAYRRLAKETHPDRHGGSTEAAARFREVTEAYALLSDPDQRTRFDQDGTVDDRRVAEATEEVLRAVAYVRHQATKARAAATRAAVIGSAWLAFGLFITIGSLLSVGDDGGRYVVMWGAIIFGGYQAIRGFTTRARINAEADRLERELWSYITE